MLSGPKLSFFDFGNLNADESGSEEIARPEDKQLGAWLLIHLISVAIILHLTWNGVLGAYLSIGFIQLDPSIATSIDSEFGSVIFVYLAMLALSPFWLGAFWLGLARRRNQSSLPANPSKLTKAIPYLICYAILLLCATWWQSGVFGRFAIPPHG